MGTKGLNISVTKDEIINAITRKLNGGNLNLWWIGITTDAEKRLFDELNVNELNGKWLFGKVEDNQIAKEVKIRFLKKGVKSIDENSEGNIIFVFKSET
jgi:hypothetical protein